MPSSRRPERRGPPSGSAARTPTPDSAKPRAKSTVLVIRISPEDREIVEAAAAAHELETSTWVRQTVVLAAKRWRAQQGLDVDPPPTASSEG